MVFIKRCRLCIVAAINVEGRAGNIRGPGTGEKCDRNRDLLRPTITAESCGRVERRSEITAGRVHVCIHGTRLHHVDRNALLCQVQDIVQETIIAVAKAIPDFRYDPARGSFKQWLLRITRRRIVDHLRAAYRQPQKIDLDPDALDALDDSHAALSDPSAERIDAAWEEEWERGVLAEAISRVRQTASPKQFQVFDYCVLKEWPASKVAALLQLSAAQVYLSKHRISKAVKRTARLIRDEWNRGTSGH